MYGVAVPCFASLVGLKSERGSDLSLHHQCEAVMARPNQNSCVTCYRRKKRCDKLDPCSNCSRAQIACTYRAPAPSQRHRKRLTQGDLLSKIQELESLLHSHSIPFDPLGGSWIHSAWEEKLSESHGSQASPRVSPASPAAVAGDEAEIPPAVQDLENPRPRCPT